MIKLGTVCLASGSANAAAGGWTADEGEIQWENCGTTKAWHTSTGYGRQIWRPDNPNDVFTKIRVQRTDATNTLFTSGNTLAQESTLAPGCLKNLNNALKIDVDCGESSDPEKVYFKIAEFNWHANSKVFEWKYADSYDNSAALSRKCGVAHNSGGDNPYALGACSSAGHWSNWVIWQSLTGMTVWSGGWNGDAAIIAKIGRFLIGPLDTTTNWPRPGPMSLCVAHTLGSGTELADTANNANGNTVLQGKTCVASNDAAAGFQFFKVNTGTGSDWSTWTVQRNRQNTQSTQNSATGNDIGHCLKRLTQVTSIGTKQDCSTVTNTLQFKYANYGWATQAAIMDDPEVTNIHKEKFKVNNKGGITLLHLPRDAPIGKAYLVLVAEIQELYGWNHTRLKAAKCTPTFVRNLLVAGTALGELTAVTFHARNNTAPFLMGFGNKVLWLPDGNITDAAIAYYTKDVNIPADVSFAVTEAKPGYPKAIQITIGSVKLSVRRPHIPEGRHWQFLNLQVDGLDSLQYSAHEFGGVMGFDSPSEATSKHNTCLSSARKWKGRTEAKDVSLAASSGSILQMISVDSDDDAKPDEDVEQA